MLIRIFVLKVNNEKKNLAHHEIIDRMFYTNWVGKHSSVQRIKIVDSSEFWPTTFLISFLI